MPVVAGTSSSERGVYKMISEAGDWIKMGDYSVLDIAMGAD